MKTARSLPAAILTEEAYQHYAKTESLCLGGLTEEFASTETGPGELLRPGILFQPAGEAFSNVLAGMDPLITTNRPMMILQGRQDVIRQGLAAEGGIPGAADVLPPRQGHHVMKRRQPQPQAGQGHCERGMRMHDGLSLRKGGIDIPMKTPLAGLPH